MQNSSNPLSRHFRQPKLYIKLPSNGNYYPMGSLERTVNNEYPVLAMTAKDELRFKTPDALLNGQATVDVIQSCMPNIKNAWAIPSVDIDAILIAIRIASYGTLMEINARIPKINEEYKYDVDLRTLLDTLNSTEYDNLVISGDFKIEIAPLNYKTFTEIAIKTFEERRLFSIINNTDMTDEEKIQKFNESFGRITDMNLHMVTRSVVAVQYGDDAVVTNPEYINEFFENIDKDVFKDIMKHVEEQKKKFSIKPLIAVTNDEQRAAGAPDTFEVPVSFDQSNFFA